MLDILTWLVLLLLIGGAIALGWMALTGKLAIGGTSMFFKQRGETRLEVMDHAVVDAKRRLIIIRRDDVEHLIMTGGPVDVVIETGIGSEPTTRVGSSGLSTPSEPVFQSHVATRAGRRFGERAAAGDRLQPTSLASLRRAQGGADTAPPDLSDDADVDVPPRLP